MSYLISILIAGFLGGILRGLVGFMKYQSSYKSSPFRPWYFLGTVGLSGLIGFIAAWVTKDLGVSFLGMATISPSIAFVIGYAGGDFIENLFKIISGKSSVFPI